MMRMLLLALAVSALFVVGCGSSQIRFTQDEIKDYPVDMQEHIIKGEVVTGMTPTQVRYAWGPPDKVLMSNTPDGKSQEQ
ncbi:MAG TPA: hypothetical protein VMB78_01570, partial [Dissulfurispiraceae bacterium]|nr:hypothetical protein [Dissulfurispiraceae bacterium]